MYNTLEVHVGLSHEIDLTPGGDVSIGLDIGMDNFAEMFHNIQSKYKRFHECKYITKKINDFEVHTNVADNKMFAFNTKLVSCKMHSLKKQKGYAILTMKLLKNSTPVHNIPCTIENDSGFSLHEITFKITQRINVVFSVEWFDEKIVHRVCIRYTHDDKVDVDIDSTKNTIERIINILDPVGGLLTTDSNWNPF